MPLAEALSAAVQDLQGALLARVACVNEKAEVDQKQHPGLPSADTVNTPVQDLQGARLVTVAYVNGSPQTQV